MGTIEAAAHRVRDAGGSIATAHLRHLNPMPHNTGDVVRAYRKVLIPELNLGQLSTLIRSRFLVDAKTLSKVQGIPFFTEELEAAIGEQLRG